MDGSRLLSRSLILYLRLLKALCRVPCSLCRVPCPLCPGSQCRVPCPLCLVPCVVYPVSRPLSLVLSFLFHVPCPLCLVPCVMYPAPCLHFGDCHIWQTVKPWLVFVVFLPHFTLTSHHLSNSSPFPHPCTSHYLKNQAKCYKKCRLQKNYS